jgi:hypothetical protein
VRAGKYWEIYTRLSAVDPDAVINSVADLPALLGCLSPAPQ